MRGGAALLVLSACAAGAGPPPSPRPVAAPRALPCSERAAPKPPVAPASSTPVAPAASAPAASTPAAPAPAPAAPAPDEPRLPTIATVAGRSVEIAFVEPDGRTLVGSRDVAAIRVDDEVLYPPDCGASRRSGLCSRAHRHLRSWEGKGQTLVLLRHDGAPASPDAASARFFFGAVFHGSPECGAYGFWAMRIDRRGVRVTEPLEGCFRTPHPADVGDDEAPAPELVWADPTVLLLWSEGGTELGVYALPEATFAWRRLLAVAPR